MATRRSRPAKTDRNIFEIDSGEDGADEDADTLSMVASSARKSRTPAPTRRKKQITKLMSAATGRPTRDYGNKAAVGKRAQYLTKRMEIAKRMSMMTAYHQKMSLVICEDVRVSSSVQKCKEYSNPPLQDHGFPTHGIPGPPRNSRTHHLFPSTSRQRRLSMCGG